MLTRTVIVLWSVADNSNDSAVVAVGPESKPEGEFKEVIDWGGTLISKFEPRGSNLTYLRSEAATVGYIIRSTT